jgi:hypothetical protein
MIINFIVQESSKLQKVRQSYVANSSIHIFLDTDWSNLYDVVYLDYGNCSKVVLTDIYPLLPKFARLPAQAVPCSLTKVNRFSDF